MLNVKKLKFFLIFLFSTLNFDVFSEIVEIEINNIIELRDYYEKFNLQKSATFIDFDETISKSVGCFFDKKYQFLASPDLYRTYEDISKEASVFHPFSYYEYLHTERVLMENENTKNVIQDLIDQAAFVSVLSGLPVNPSKKSFLQTHWGQFENESQLKLPYHFGDDKARRALQLVMEKFNKSAPIDNIILIDNSDKFSLQPFKEKITKYIEELPENEEYFWLKTINIILIHYKYFGNELTVEKLKVEYDDFQQKVEMFIGNIQDYISSKMEQNFDRSLLVSPQISRASENDKSD